MKYSSWENRRRGRSFGLILEFDTSNRSLARYEATTFYIFELRPIISGPGPLTRLSAAGPGPLIIGRSSKMFTHFLPNMCMGYTLE